MSWQSIWSVAELLKRLSIVSWKYSAEHRPSHSWMILSETLYSYFPPFSPWVKMLQIDYGLNLTSNCHLAHLLSFPSSPAAHTHTQIYMASWRDPLLWIWRGGQSYSPLFPARWWVTSPRIQRSLSNKPIHPLTPPLKDGEINCGCVRRHLHACVRLCAEMLSRACVSLASRCVHTHLCVHKCLKVREVNFRLPTQDIVSQFDHDSTSWCAAAHWLNALLLMAAVHVLCLSSSYTHKHNQSHANTPANTIQPFWSWNVSLAAIFSLCLAASVNQTWKPLLFLGEKNESL